MPTPSEISTLTQWLQQRLKEYFVKKARGLKLVSTEDDYDWLFSLSANQGNGLPIQTAISDFRILDLELEKEPDVCNNLSGDESDDQEDLCDVLRLPLRKDNEPYKQRNSHVYLIYQEGSQCVGKELRLFLYASQFERTKPNPSLKERSLPARYMLSLDERQIDVYTKVFEIFKEWIQARNIGITLPIPECYHASYHREEEIIGSSSVKDTTLNDILLTDDDILSKVAAGLEIMEKDKKMKEMLNAPNVPVKESGFRILVTEDMYKTGYKLKNVSDSTFLSLMNVEEALKSLAAVHCTSWAFSETTGKSLLEMWPFLQNNSYSTYIHYRVKDGYPRMVLLVEDYLARKSAQKPGEDETEIARILRSLQRLRTRLAKVIDSTRNPRTIQCIVHQDACFSSFLFRYNIQTKKQGKSGDSKKSPSTSTKGSQDFKENELKREVKIINWRTASIGSPMIDVAFLLMTALPPMTRRAETANLLRTYWNTFRTNARKFGLSLVGTEEEVLQEYLAALLYSCVLISGNIQKNWKLSDEGIEVFVQAMKDLIAAELI